MRKNNLKINHILFAYYVYTLYIYLTIQTKTNIMTKQEIVNEALQMEVDFAHVNLFESDIPVASENLTADSKVEIDVESEHSIYYFKNNELIAVDINGTYYLENEFETIF